MLIVTGKPGASPGVTDPASALFWSIKTTPSTASAGNDTAAPRTPRAIDDVLSQLVILGFMDLLSIDYWYVRDWLGLRSILTIASREL
jgi:hypothetical protein